MSRLVAANSSRFEAHGTLGSFVSHHLDVQEDQLKANMLPGAIGFGVDKRPAYLVLENNAQIEIEREVGDYRHYYAGVRDAILHKQPSPGSSETRFARLLNGLNETVVRCSASRRSRECDAIDANVHR